MNRSAMRLAFFVLMMVWGYASLAVSGQDSAYHYHGQVVDAETNQPLEGAVVVIVWYRKPMISMDGPIYFHRAFEALTDANGKFSLDATPGIDWNPFTYVLKDPSSAPEIVIFSPGYGLYPYAVARTERIDKLEESMRKEGAVVKLPKLKTEEEMKRYADFSIISPCTPGRTGSGCVPPEKIRNMIRLINIQRKSLGFPLYAEPG